MGKYDDLKGAIRVRTSVYKAAQMLDVMMRETGGDVFRATEALFHCFRNDREPKLAELWADVWEFEKELMAADAGTAVIVVPEAQAQGQP